MHIALLTVDCVVIYVRNQTECGFGVCAVQAVHTPGVFQPAKCMGIGEYNNVQFGTTFILHGICMYKVEPYSD